MKGIRALTTVAVVCILLLHLTSAYTGILGNKPTISLILTRGKRSIEDAQPAQNCSKDVVDNITKSVKETCSQISTVDKYISVVSSRQQFPVPSFTDRHGFRSILDQYNNDLRTAQGNCHPWRNGDSVVGSLREMIVVAHGFEPKFNAELEENKIRVRYLLENHEDIAAVEAKIAALEEDIRQAKGAAELAVAPPVLRHLEHFIKSKEEAINITLKEHGVTQARRELAELVSFLEFVKTSAAEVEAKAGTAANKINDFRDSMVRDAGSFKRHRTNAQEAISRLREERRNNDEIVTNNRRNINDLRAQIAEDTTNIISLNRKIEQAQKELKEIEDRIERNLKKAKKKKKFGQIFRLTSVTGWFIGNKFYKDALKKERELAEQKRAFISEHTLMVQNLQDHVARCNQDIASNKRRIASLELNTGQIAQEQYYFKQLDAKLQGVESEVNVILPSITNAVEGVSQMRETFDDIQQNLADVVERAKEAQTEAEINNMKYFIYNEIAQLKCKWDDARNKIVPLGQCSSETLRWLA